MRGLAAAFAGWCVLAGDVGSAEPAATRESDSSARLGVGPLLWEEVSRSVATQYPPYLAALIERDIAAGRLRGAEGAFDFNTFAKAFGNPNGYYEPFTFDAGFEQFLGLWGATVYGGYRITTGDLPDYYRRRTQGGGEPRIGLKVPLLQDGSIDYRRAGVLKARLDQELADPAIWRQYLDFLRAARVAYSQWLTSGQRWLLAEEILRVAQDRREAIRRQIERGLSAPIIEKENEQLVVSRELALVRARRRFEAASLTLSLFHRNQQDQPVVAGRERLPSPLPRGSSPEDSALEDGLAQALRERPELRQLDLAAQKLGIDLRLARNALLPRLDAGVEASQGVGEDLYRDKGEFELKLGLEFRMPLQRRQARGQVEETRGRLDQLGRQIAFARDRIAAEVRNAHLAVVAAHEQIERAGLNAQLAGDLLDVEQDRFRLGATDLLALQIREQAAFQARVDEVDAIEQYLVANADFLAAIAADPRPEGDRGPRSSPANPPVAATGP